MAQNMVLSGPRGWYYIVLELFEHEHKFLGDFDMFLTRKHPKINHLGHQPSVFEKSVNWWPTQMLVSRVPFRPACQDASFEWFPGSYRLVVWPPEPFFCKVVKYFPGSVVVFEKSANWWPSPIWTGRVSSEPSWSQLSIDTLGRSLGSKISSPELF